MSDEKEFELEGEKDETTISQEKELRGAANSVGEILRKKRVTKRITIETIAKDLKLSESYIEAIEANDYKNLPADPYVRVYLKSIASYLMLDPNEILNTFLEEKGTNSIDNELRNSNKIDINLSESSSSAKLKSLYIIAIIVALIGLSFFSNKDKMFSDTAKKDIDSTEITDSSETPEQDYYDSIQAIPVDSTSITDSSITDTTKKESLDSSKTITPKPVVASSVEKKSDNKKLSLLMTAKDASVWVQVFADGKPWTNTIAAGKSKLIEANDSLNIKVGNNFALSYTLNGKPLTINGNGVKYFRILANEKLFYWSSTRWKTVFAERI